MATHSNSLTNVNRKTTVGSKLRAQFKACKNILVFAPKEEFEGKSVLEMTGRQLRKFFKS